MTPNLEAIATEIRVMQKIDSDAPVDIEIQPAKTGIEARVIVFIPEFEIVSYKDLQWLQKRLFTRTWFTSIYVSGTHDGGLRLSISTIGLKARYHEKES